MVNLALVSNVPKITESDILLAKNTITDENTAKLIGQISHLTYWSVFGHINQMSLDKYHRKQLFI